MLESNSLADASPAITADSNSKSGSSHGVDKSEFALTWTDSITSPRPQVSSLLSSARPLGRESTANNAATNTPPTGTQIRAPHSGSLYRIAAADSRAQSSSQSSAFDYLYVLPITLENGLTHDLHFEPPHYNFLSRLFSILDTENHDTVGRAQIMDFVTLRCPVFWRRDSDLRKLGGGRASARAIEQSYISSSSPTFDEVWTAVTLCCNHKHNCPGDSLFAADVDQQQLGVEGWMVFCRFVALAQYLEAKRRFSARHLQQTMRHHNSPRSSEVVVVNVPPPEPPTPLTPSELADYEEKVRYQLPLPELDLDHSLVAAHDNLYNSRRAKQGNCPGKVKICLFGSPASSTTASGYHASSSHLDFAVTYIPSSGMNHEAWSEEDRIVRRSFADMQWLNDTFTSHKELGGTLCGRILPPFPNGSTSSNSSSTGKISTALNCEDSLRKASGTTEGAQMAIAAAAAGVDMITSAAKSFWGSYVAPSSLVTRTPVNIGASHSPTIHSSAKRINPSQSRAVMADAYYSSNSPVGKSRQLERYLNYLLEHPALSTSFPLNTILMASQSGLEAAKQSLAHHAKSLLQEQQQHQQQSHGSHFEDAKNLSWVRTAAQAAMALKVHGMLETTGLPSASAKLQHASLPKYSTSSRTFAWATADEETREKSDSTSGGESDIFVDGAPRALTNAKESDPCGESFELGVVQVESELHVSNEGIDSLGDEAYELLPDPVPAPERRILCAGSSAGEGVKSIDESPQSADIGSRKSNGKRNPTRFHYGGVPRQQSLAGGAGDGTESTFLGDFSVDDGIDKLREVIGSVDNTLSQCLTASAGIGRARRNRLRLHQDIVTGFDSWEGLRGKFITQRALLKGVSGLEQSREVSEESDLDLIDDISWQTSLASSAVSAAEDVRSTVRAARIAGNAKAAADSATLAAQSFCDTRKFASVDDARAAQTRASIAQSHAIHAAVVEHEAKSVKRRAALALANDVKCWNVHRKREMLRTCLCSARSQLEASRRGVDAWSCLRDGFLGTTVVPMSSPRSYSSRSNKGHATHHSEAYSNPAPPSSDTVCFDSVEDVAATILSHTVQEGEIRKIPSILPVNHDILTKSDAGFEQEISDTFDLFTPLPPQEEPPVESIDLPVVPPEYHSEEAEDTFDDTLAQKKVEVEEIDKMSSSMQSLVNGLMTWGGQFDSEEDLTLPTGMAASIVMEESGI